MGGGVYRACRALPLPSSQSPSTNLSRPSTVTLVADALLAAAFASYAGPLTAQLRADLVASAWLPDLRNRGLPLSDSASPMDLLADDAAKARGV